MRIIVRPIVDPQSEIDVTRRLVSVIAEELWRIYGGNEQLNWIEAERHLERMVDEARAEPAVSTAVAGPAPARPAMNGRDRLGREKSGRPGCARRQIKAATNGRRDGRNSDHRPPTGQREDRSIAIPVC